MKWELLHSRGQPSLPLHREVRLTIPERCCLPVIIVMGKTSQSRKAALISFLLSLFPLPFLLPSAILFEQLQFSIYLLCCFSVQRKSWACLTKNSFYLVNKSISNIYVYMAFLKISWWEYALLDADFFSSASNPSSYNKVLSSANMRSDVLLHLGLTGSL